MTPLATVAVTLPLVVKFWLRSLDALVAPLVFVVLDVVVSVAQFTVFGPDVTTQVANAGPAAANAASEAAIGHSKTSVPRPVELCFTRSICLRPRR